MTRPTAVKAAHYLAEAKLRAAHEQGADFLAALLATADRIQLPPTVGSLPVPSSPPFGRDGQEVANRLKSGVQTPGGLPGIEGKTADDLLWSVSGVAR